jgi:hypothetical protein
MTDKKTLVENLQPEDFKVNCVNIDDDVTDIQECLMDCSGDLNHRITLLNDYYKKYDMTDTMELISKISTIYQFSGTKLMEKYLYEICINSEIPVLLQIITAKSLCYFDPKKELGYKALNKVCQNMEGVATPCQIETVSLLMLHTSYKQQARDYFCKIINNSNLECDYRYKAILSLENKDIPKREYFIYEAIIEFFNTSTNMTLYRILGGQYLIQKFKLEEKIREKTELTLMSFAQDPDLDYNLRADSADVILSLGSTENKVLAREIIMMLGRQDGNVKTIFDNAQNVHVDEIEQSVMEALEFLSGITMKTLSGVPITLDYVKKQIEEELEKSKPKEPKEYKEYIIRKEKAKKDGKKVSIMPRTNVNKICFQYEHDKSVYDEKEDKINVSLNRIYMDRALYSVYNCSLLHILLKIWTYLTSHDSEDVMKTRLLEELIEMSGTCSSGFASRLVNVISGFGDFNLSISWRDQIIANFNGRLNARARDITVEQFLRKNIILYGILPICDCCDNYSDSFEKHRYTLMEKLEDFQGYVLEEMSLNCSDFESRKNFLKFFRKNMLSIRQELYEEFKEHIPDTDFDLYFRAAISSYETGGYV